MRVFKVKWFTRYAKQEGIDDKTLSEAIERVEMGLVDADLGGNLIKIRIPRKGQGRSGGYRTLIAYKKNKMAVFLYGFSKNESDNISKAQEKSLKELVTRLIKSSAQEINKSINNGTFEEVDYEKN